MLTQADAQIYLEGLRGEFQTDGFRSFRTFNFEEYCATDREAVGTLEVLNDETLMPECSYELHSAKHCQIILFPMVGAIEVEERGKEPKFVNSGEAMFLNVAPESIYTITNPYPDEPVNYLQIRINNDPFLSTPMPLSRVTTQFDLRETNVLLPIPGHDGSSAQLFIGKYDGREEGVFTVKTQDQKAFIFIIEGAFEVQNRLLEKRDGLALSNVEEIEFEALSNGAVLLVMTLSQRSL